MKAPVRTSTARKAGAQATYRNPAITAPVKRSAGSTDLTGCSFQRYRTVNATKNVSDVYEKVRTRACSARLYPALFRATAAGSSARLTSSVTTA
jgi:hypothetical protein